VQCFAALVKDTSTKTDPEDLLGYGEALIMNGDAARAELALLRVVQVSPQMAPAHNALGMAQFKQNHYKDAVDSFREAIRLVPDESRYRFNMAIADMAMRNREGALSQYNLLKQSNPKLAGQLYNMMFADKVLVVGH
jgi:Flp pilus assembly protein TadD